MTVGRGGKTIYPFFFIMRDTLISPRHGSQDPTSRGRGVIQLSTGQYGAYTEHLTVSGSLRVSSGRRLEHPFAGQKALLDHLSRGVDATRSVLTSLAP